MAAVPGGPIQHLASDRAGARPGDGTVRWLLPHEFFVNSADNVICMLSATGVMQIFYQLNAAGFAAFAATLPTTLPPTSGLPWLNNGSLNIS